MPFFDIYGSELDEENPYRKMIEDAVKYDAPFINIVQTASGYALLLAGSVIELVSDN